MAAEQGIEKTVYMPYAQTSKRFERIKTLWATIINHPEPIEKKDPKELPELLSHTRGYYEITPSKSNDVFDHDVFGYLREERSLKDHKTHLVGSTMEFNLKFMSSGGKVLVSMISHEGIIVEYSRCSRSFFCLREHKGEKVPVLRVSGEVGIPVKRRSPYQDKSEWLFGLWFPKATEQPRLVRPSLEWKDVANIKWSPRLSNAGIFTGTEILSDVLPLR